MNCPLENRENEELLLNYAAGTLDAQRAALFERHTLSCAACAKFAREQKAVWGALDVFEPARVSADFDRRLYERMNRGTWWDRITAAFQPPLLARRGLPVAAAAAVLVAAGVLWEHPTSKPVQPQTALRAAAESIQPDQVQQGLDDMEMLREFNHLMRSGSPESKM